MTMATLSHVHTSPRKPCASAPRCRSSGTLARCSSLKRGRAPGAGRRLRASTPPPSRARFIHWLTAPLLTPRASAMRCWDHHSCLSSQALRRLPSRQSVASFESELSMSRSYHCRLAISAEIYRTARGSVAILDQIPHKREVEGLMQMTVEVILWDELFEGKIGQWDEVTELGAIIVAHLLLR